MRKVGELQSPQGVDRAETGHGEGHLPDSDLPDLGLSKVSKKLPVSLCGPFSMATPLRVSCCPHCTGDNIETETNWAEFPVENALSLASKPLSFSHRDTLNPCCGTEPSH